MTLALALVAIPLTAATALAVPTHRFSGRVKFERVNNELRADLRVGVAPGSSATGIAVSAQVDMLGSDADLSGAATRGGDAEVGYTASLEPDFGPYKAVVTYAGVRQTFLFDALPKEEGASVDKTAELGVAVRLTATDVPGEIELTVGNQDPAWDPGKLGAVELSDGAGPAALDSEGTSLVYAVSLGYVPPCDIAGERGICTFSLRRADGTLLDSRIDLQEFSDAGCGLQLGKLTVDATRSGDVKVTAFSTSGPNEGPSFLTVSVTDDATGQSLLNVSAAAPTESQRHFLGYGLTFEDPAAADGETYTAVLELTLASGARAYAQTDLVVGGAQTGFVAALERGGDIAGAAFIEPIDGSSFQVFVAVEGRDVASVQVQFLDYTGPAPVPNQLALSLAQEWQKWVLKGNAGTGSIASGKLLSAVATLTDARGALRDVEGGSVAELPARLFSRPLRHIVDEHMLHVR